MAIWFGTTPALDDLNTSREVLLAGHLGIRFSEIGEDFLRATMPVDNRTRQPMGLLHGGASMALAETVGSVAAYLVIDRSKFRCVGQEINGNHLRAVRDGLVTATAKPFHIGARSHVWGIEIRDPGERMVCISRLTMAVIDWRPT